MPYFDKFDICEAHYALEIDYNVSGVLQERPSNKRRNMSTDYQLHRMGYKSSPMFNGFESLSENSKDIYMDLVTRYSLPAPEGEEFDEYRRSLAE